MAEAKKPESVLVIGGGVAGTQAALDLAGAGVKTYLLDSLPSIGGHMAQLDKTFPTNDCSLCILSPKLVEAGRDENIELRTYCELAGVNGSAPRFRVKIRHKPTYVNWDVCTGCGSCAEKCPKKVPNLFDYGMSRRKAIYVQFPQAVPLKYTIDPEPCLYFRTGKCKLCEKACQLGAIDFDQKEWVEEIEVNSIIVATGYDQLNPENKKEFGYGIYKDVITGLEFERLLNASGPTLGEIKRNDGEVPEKVAILHCVGSRDVNSCSWCSRVCCTYAIKHAMIAREHAPGMGMTLFYMDMRTFGKGFEEYKDRAREEGINLKLARVAEIQETGGKLALIYEEGDEVKTEKFDLVVLESAMVPTKGAVELAEKLGIDLDDNGFFKEMGPLYPLHSTKEGIFLAGCSQGPKDIPDSVAMASGAASLAQRYVLCREFPKEVEVEPIDTGGEPRIGVFICHCGINIGGVVDVPAVTEFAKTLPNVVFAAENIYSCSDDTQKLIAQQIRDKKLNRVVIAACTPRTHQPLFQKTLKMAGLNPYLFEFANIRDQCSWVHRERKEEATEKARDLVKMAVSKVALQKPLTPFRIEITKSALVIGGGIAGMVSALDLVDQGYEVHLVEKEGKLGGRLNDLGNLAISDADAGKLTEDLISQIDRSTVQAHLNCRLERVDGFIGNFVVYLSDGSELEVGTLIIAIGADVYKPREYGYGENSRVMTNLEFEGLNVKVEGKRVIFIQCIGARNQEFAGCSRYCCQTSLGQAMQAQEKGAQATILHRDIRAFSKGAEELYRKVAGMGVGFIRFPEDREPKLVDGKIIVHDSTLDTDLTLDFDLLVLAASMRPPADAVVLQKMLKTPLDQNGYFMERHPKLGPVETNTDGIYLCGTCQYPKDIADTIAQAHGAAEKASMILSRDFVEAEPIIAVVDGGECTSCGTCIKLCPYNAISKEEENRAYVNPVLCKGCGVCVASCPEHAIEMNYFTKDGLIEQIRAALEV